MRGRLITGCAALAFAASVLTPASAAVGSTSLGSYIVVLKGSVRDATRVAGQQAVSDGLEITGVYRHALKGYSARVPSDRLGALRADPRVSFVADDTDVFTQKTPSPVNIPPTEQVVTIDVHRIDGPSSTAVSGDRQGAVDTNIAVLDTGIDLQHPDLNVVGGVNCSNSRDYDDSDGHGSHVSGTLAARDNGIGVVGVAPGARLWSVRVANNKGRGKTSTLLCGIDWITATRTDADPTNDIAVANVSFGGSGSDDGNCGRTDMSALHLAICRSSDAGVTYVAAAGNDGADLASNIPASYDEVLSVTAMVDSDGQSGGTGGPDFCRSYPDDTIAPFSNFATLPLDRAHTVAAPGECVGSTYSDGRYATLSGTSMAAPHVTGMVALCIWSGACAGLTPAQIITKIVNDASSYNTANPSYGYAGDPLRPIADHYFGYLARAAAY